MVQTKLKKNMTICFLSITFFTFKEKNLNLRTQWKIKCLEKKCASTPSLHTEILSTK